MSKRHMFIVSALLLAGTNGAALAQQGANGPATSVPAPSGGPVGSPTATPGATSGVNPNAGFGSSSAGGSFLLGAKLFPMTNQDITDRIWNMVEKVGVCMLTIQFHGGMRARPLEARPDRK